MTYPISTRISFSGQQKLGKLPNTVSLWLENAIQCRRPTGHSSIAAAAAWTHEGTYLIYGFLASISFRPRNPSWIWIRYIQYATTGTTLCHPQNWLCRCDALFPLSFHLWATLMETTHASLPDAQNSRWLQSSFPPMATWLSLNSGEHDPSHVRWYALPFSTFS